MKKNKTSGWCQILYSFCFHLWPTIPCYLNNFLRNMELSTSSQFYHLSDHLKTGLLSCWASLHKIAQRNRLAVPHYICKNVLVFSVFLFVCRWDEREEGTRVPAARWGVPGIPESQVANMRKGKGDREQDIQMVTKWDGERWRLKTNTSLPAFMLSVVKSSSLPSHLSDSQMIAWTNAGFAQAVNLFFSFYTCYSFDG